MGLDRLAAEGHFLSGRTPEYSLAGLDDGMSTFDDDNIAFDFFDEPETVETTRRGRRRGPGAAATARGARRCALRRGSFRSRGSSG